MPTYNPLANSTFLDAFGAGLYSAQQYQEVAAGNTAAADATLAQFFNYGSHLATWAPSDLTITVGLVLNRAADPTALLSGSWGERQAALADQAAIWSTYGADPALYAATSAAVAGVVGGWAPLQAATDTGYVSSAADRTIWLTLNPAQFQTLFGASLLTISSYTDALGHYGVPAWAGNLGINSQIPAGAVAGLWFDYGASITNPQLLDGALVPLSAGPLGVGNNTLDKVTATPAAVAANYAFPLPPDVPTDPIAVVETNISLPGELFTAYNQYREAVGLAPVTPAQFQVLSGNASGPGAAVISELTLDISVVAGAGPNSTQLIYSDLGGTPYNAYQQAFFDTVHHPAVLTSSYPVAGQPTAQSPFQWAWQQLFVDGALANVSVHMAGGDQGSSANIANGFANVANTHSSPFTLQVGGTSIASFSDSTLAQMLALAQQDDPATVFTLVASGLRTLLSHLSAAAPQPSDAATTLTALFESVWQALSLTPSGNTLEGEFGANQSGSGGVAIQVPTPDYQTAYGLASLTQGGRGSPDVAALASGDSFYAALNDQYVTGVSGATLLHGVGGTSAAAPLWASLTTQFNTIFHDQGLPHLGYYNDLLYYRRRHRPGLLQRRPARQQHQQLLHVGRADLVLQATSASTWCRRASAIRPPWTTTWRAASARPTAPCWRARSPRSPTSKSPSPTIPTCSTRTVLAAGRAAPTRACCSRRRRPTTVPPSASSSVRMPSVSSARPRAASPGPPGWPSSRSSLILIQALRSCSTSRGRAR
jgi:hypothetical protein